jgi:pimeloyl-ACP methyl ester carboxylesterase
MLVAVHGISINAREQARWFAPWAEKTGAILVAPLFEPSFFPDYQRLGRTGLGQRADLALHAMLDAAAAEAGVSNPVVNLFGFSGGGQFAHRYAMANPQRVKGQVLAAPGWFTFPDAERFPYGIKPTKRLPGVTFDPRGLLGVDSLVVVGSGDVDRDPALRRSKRVDRRQGRNRIDRGRRWIEAMRDQAAAEGLETRFEFAQLSGCGHDYEQCMQFGGLGERTIAFLYPDYRNTLMT